MFIPAGELRDWQQHIVHGNEIREQGTAELTYEAKLEESKQPEFEGSPEDYDLQEFPPYATRNRGGGVHQSIKESGAVHTPIRLVSRPDVKEQEEEGIISMPKDHFPGDTQWKSLIRDGMHRITSAADIDPKMEVPVQWERNIHWEHDTDDEGNPIPGKKGRPMDPDPPPPPPSPWDTEDTKWIDRSKSGSDGHYWANQYRTTRDEDTGQVGTEWEHYGPTASEELRPTGQTISAKTLARLRDPDDLGDG
jgi:hypothetical protein